MSGHSKWSTIKHKKESTDQKRGKLFSQISRTIPIAVRQSGTGDPDLNPSLRLALEKARAANMPGENINRAIRRGLGRGDSGALEEVTYEGYGPGGVGVMVIAHTDNRQRTTAEIRNILERQGGSLGGPGSAAFLFERNGVNFAIKVPLPVSDQPTREQVSKLVDSLTEHDDVETVVTNLA